jgi:hypothetical protein
MLRATTIEHKAKTGTAALSVSKKLFRNACVK